jgi:hypothetical protein
MQLVQVSVLGATHKYPTIFTANDGRHFNITRYGQICGIEFDFLVCTPLSGKRGKGHPDEENRDRSADHKKRGYFINKKTSFRFDESDMSDHIWLIDE